MLRTQGVIQYTHRQRWHARALSSRTTCATKALPDGEQDALCRRSLLLSSAAAALAARAAPAQALAEPCELQAAESGLLFCDLAVGAGAVPARGALVKWVPRSAAPPGHLLECCWERAERQAAAPPGIAPQRPPSRRACRVHYTASFAGSEAPFDSSYARQQPLIFKVSCAGPLLRSPPLRPGPVCQGRQGGGAGPQLHCSTSRPRAQRGPAPCVGGRWARGR
jgi:hypothetical protein